MNEITELAKIEFRDLFITVFVILIAVKAVVSILEWMIDKLGLETKWMRQKRQDHELLIQLSNSEKEREKQIEALICGSKELLGAEIDARYRDYISLDGIPESEVDEFDDIFSAYKRLNGNHRRDTKYNYVKTHLRVIPVETKWKPA